MSFTLNYKLGVVAVALSGAAGGFKCSVSHFKIDLITAVSKRLLTDSGFGAFLDYFGCFLVQNEGAIYEVDMPRTC